MMLRPSPSFWFLLKCEAQLHLQPLELANEQVAGTWYIYVDYKR